MAIFGTKLLSIPKRRRCCRILFLDQGIHGNLRPRCCNRHHHGILVRTNWADYARFVGDIFGAPLAAEALLAFFLESVFLGVLLFGRKKVSGKFYLVSAWLVWLGSCLSALWIIIANSWMQTRQAPSFLQTAPRHS